MRDREENLQQTPIGNLRRIVRDLHGFSVTGVAFFHGVILRGVRGAARVTSRHLFHSAHVFENALHAPKAAAGEHGGFAMGCADFLVLSRRGNLRRRFG
jgi:hypothetical protein